MSELDSTPEVLDATELTDDEAAELAADVVATVEVLADEIDVDEAAGTGPLGIGPGAALNILLPLIRKWAEGSPRAVLVALSRVSLEAEALANKHGGTSRRELVELDDEL